jgi:hypothetical protein
MKAEGITFDLILQIPPWGKKMKKHEKKKYVKFLIVVTVLIQAQFYGCIFEILKKSGP